MSHGTIEPNELELEIRDLVLALPVEHYKQGIDRPAWAETDTAGVLEVDNAAASHLKFRVFVSGVAAGRSHGSDSVHVTSRLVVEFLFRLRSGREVSDGRDAWNAARDVRRAVMSNPDQRFAVVLVDAGRAYGDEDGEVRLFQISFDVSHEIEV